MMKHLFFIFVFVLYGCTGNSQKGTENDTIYEPMEMPSPTKYTNIYHQYNEGVKLATSQSEYSIKKKDVFEYSIYNLDNYQVLTGNSIILDYWDGENWTDYSFDRTSIDIQHIIKEDKTRFFEHHLLTDERYPLKPGKYRIIKDLSVIFREGEREQRFKLYSEFFVVD